MSYIFLLETEWHFSGGKKVQIALGMEDIERSNRCMPRTIIFLVYLTNKEVKLVYYIVIELKEHDRKVESTNRKRLFSSFLSSS